MQYQTDGMESNSVSELDCVQHIFGDINGDLRSKVERLMFLCTTHDRVLDAENLLTFGGVTVQEVWREARWSYIHGNYIATVLLCQGFVEHLVASTAFGAGEKLPKRATLRDALKRAFARGYISEDEVEDIERLIALRNPLSHFRRPLDPSSISGRAVTEDEEYHELLKRDGRFAIELATKMLSKLSTGTGDR